MSELVDGKAQRSTEYCKTHFFACPLFREFREPGKFAKITGREKFEYSNISV